jgi:hypothetical protein
VLIPPAFGLAGVNLHTYTGWGSVTYWNALVANLEMHGLGTFYDPRLNDATKFPIAAVNGFGNVRNEPDLITSKLAALHVYELDLQAPTPPAGSFDAAAAQRGAGQSSTGRGNARPATCRRSSPSPDGTCTRRRRSASTPSRPIALRPIVTARPRSRVSSPTPRGLLPRWAVLHPRGGRPALQHVLRPRAHRTGTGGPRPVSLEPLGISLLGVTSRQSSGA